MLVGPAYGCSSGNGSSALIPVEADADAEDVNTLLCACTERSTRTKDDLLMLGNQQECPKLVQGLPKPSVMPASMSHSFSRIGFRPDLHGL